MKKGLLLFFLSLSIFSFGQRGVIENLKGFDRNKTFHFGFLLGLNYMGSNLKLNNSVYTTDTIYGLNVKQTPGFTLGVVTDLHIGEFWDLRAMFPTLAFGQRDFEYSIQSDDGIFVDVRQSESTYLMLPLELKYKSARYGNWRAYVTGGGFIGYDMVSQKNVDEGVAVVRLDKWDYGYSVGFGLEFFLEYFKFAPHIKWDQGVKNLIINDNTPFTNVIDNLKSRTFSICLTFEG